MLGCVNTDCGFSPDYGGDMCIMLECLENDGCMDTCSDTTETIMFDGIAYFCDAPAGCEELFDMDDEENGPPECLVGCPGIENALPFCVQWKCTVRPMPCFSRSCNAA